MKLLYSNILPLGTEDGQESVIDRFFAEAHNSDRIDIATGYISKASLIVSVPLPTLPPQNR